MSAGGQLPSPSYAAEKAEQTQQLPLSMDHLLGTSHTGLVLSHGLTDSEVYKDSL